MAPKDKPTFASIFRARRLKRLLSIKLLVSKAKDDMVVKEPQNPTATSRVYFGSRFNAGDIMEKKPKMKLPKMFTIKTLIGSPYTVTGDSTSL